MASVIERLTANFTDPAQPKLYRDKILNAGSKFLFDFVTPYCNPNADGAIANGATFKNLLDGGPDAVYVAGSGGITNRAGKAGLVLGGGAPNANNAARIDLGAGLNLPTAGHPFVVVAWFKMLSGTLVNNAPVLEFRSADGQWMFYTGVDGKTPAGIVRNGAVSVQADAAASGTVLDQVVQIALSWAPGTVTTYRNGAQVAQTAGAAANTLPDMPGLQPAIKSVVGTHFYRAYQEDLSVSGLSPLAVVQADYAANNGRFT